MSLRRALSLLCLALSAAAVAGCGGDTFSFDPVASAASKTATSQSSRVEFTATMTVAGNMSFSGSGVFDGRTRSGALNMRFQLPPEAQAQLGGVDPSMQMIMDGHSGLVMYMRSPMFKTLPAGKWVKVDLAQLAKRQGVDLQALMNANQADPSQTLDMLTASTDAHPLGYDRVRGVLTTHYKLNIDLQRLARHDKELRKSYDMLRKLTSITSFPAEAWIDSAGRVRRVKLDMSMGVFTLSMTEDLYAFGIKVNVPPPDASQVLDLSALTG
jgi:hypothetical protein